MQGQARPSRVIFLWPPWGIPFKDPPPSVVRMREKWRETLGQQSLQHMQRCFYHSLEGEDRKGSGCRPRAGARMGWGTMGRVCSGPEKAISPFWVPSS